MKPLHRNMKRIFTPFVAMMAALAATGASSGPRPHILFLLSDDHSYPFLGCYGDSNVREALIEKMILDYDYLPLPNPDGGASTTRAKKRRR